MAVWDPITQTQTICACIHGVGSIPTLASKPNQLELKGFGNFHR